MKKLTIFACLCACLLAVGTVYVGLCSTPVATPQVPLEQATPQAEPAPESPEVQPETPAIEEPPAPVDPVEQYLSGMSVAQKIGQLLMADLRYDANGNPITTLTDPSRITDYHLGGVILFAENLVDETQTQQLIVDMQAVADLPLLVGVDEEGGAVSRLANSDIPHTTYPPMGMLTTTEAVAAAGADIGQTLCNLGFHVDFAPCADVNTNPNNTVIGPRAFSSDPQIAAERVRAFVMALQSTGISGVCKHFPGHGDTQTDSHYGIASVSHDLERLRTVEFLPFQAAVDAGVDMVMVGHISVPAVSGDDMPASLSPCLVDLVRSELGFDGVIITDAMNMQAITDIAGAGQAAVLAVQAGVDIVLMPADLDAAFTALEQAVATEDITLAQLDAHVARVLRLKFEKGLL